MDEHFYRNLQPEKFLKRLARSAKRHKRRTVFIVLATLVFLYMVFDNKGLITRIRLERQQRVWREQLQIDSVETQRLLEEIHALETNRDTIERIARERYGMVRKGETVYQIPTDSLR